MLHTQGIAIHVQFYLVPAKIKGGEKVTRGCFGNIVQGGPLLQEVIRQCQLKAAPQYDIPPPQDCSSSKIIPCRCMTKALHALPRGLQS